MIDAHAHLSNTSYGNVELYLEQLQQAGIKKGIAVPGGMLDVRRMTDYIIGRSQPDSTVPDNAYVQQCVNANQPVLRGFVCVDPHDDHALEVIDKSHKDGFQGLKLSPMSHQFSFASRAISNIVELCANYGFPVYTHVLYSPGASTSKFVSLAKQFPKANFILGHMGFGPADQDGLEAACKLDNFYLETSTGNFLHIQQSVKKAGAGKVIFGSEFPLSHPKAELEKVLLLDLPDSELEKILGRNIESLLPSKGTKG